MSRRLNMRKRTPTKRELLEILASKGWDEPQLIRLNMRLLKRINDELAPLLVPQFMPWDKNYPKRSKRPK